MDTTDIIAQIDAEIVRLQQVMSILSGEATTKAKHSRPKNASGAPVAGKRVMSAEGRARIVAAQKARWAKIKKTKKAT